MDDNSTVRGIMKISVKEKFFGTDSCLLALSISNSHMQSCFQPDLGLLKSFNVLFLCLKV